MNKDIQQKAQVLNEWILSQDVVKEFQKYEALVQNNEELRSLEDELKDLQKKIVNAKHQGLDCQQLIMDYQEKKKRFDEHPLIFNYLNLKQEVNDLICYIQEDINQQLHKMVD